MPLRIATYNVNSIRIRMRALKRLTDEHAPDVICLQETKVEDSKFPVDELRGMGYDHIIFSGQKSYNGVAMLSKHPLTEVETIDLLDAGHKRHISAKVAGKLVVHNFYLPAGGDIPDRELNEKFDFKLRCYDAVAQWSLAQKNSSQHLVFVGDLNVAPLVNDVWSHKQLLGVVSHTPVETGAMERLQKTIGWVDTARHFLPEPTRLYSWWSYRNQDWRKSDRGRRLDHIWVTPSIKGALTGALTLKDARGWDTPSDHVPVIANINI